MPPYHSEVNVPSPTPYAGINALLERILAGARAVLADEFTGMILQGSLVAGDFDAATSDIDFVVVTAGVLPAETVAALEAMHKQIASEGSLWAERSEGSYIPQKALRRYDPADAHYPALRTGGSFGIDHHGVDWVIQRHVIREWGLSLAGPSPKELIDVVAPDDLRWAARETLREWWQPQLNESFRLDDGLYQKYAVLTMCRALYTVRQGDVVSKPAAAKWAQAALGEDWAGLIARALDWNPDQIPPGKDAVLALIRHTLELTQTE